MKVLLLADLHGDESILDRLRAISGKYDMIIVAGDLGNDRYIEEVLSISEKIYWIPGNMERLESCEAGKEKCIHGRRMDITDGMNIVGFGFSGPTPFGTPGELSEEEIYQQMNALPIDEKTILITHTPPYGILDDVGDGIHAGSKSVKKILDEKTPRMLACGHIHHVEGKENVGKTTVVQIPEGRTLKGVLLIIENGQIMIKMESL